VIPCFLISPNLEIPGPSKHQSLHINVVVNPLNGLNGPGLEFVVNKTALAGQFFDVRIGYLVSNNTFSGITLSMTGSSATGDGAVTTIEEVWPDGPSILCLQEVSNLIVFDIEADKDTPLNNSLFLPFCHQYWGY